MPRHEKQMSAGDPCHVDQLVKVLIVDDDEVCREILREAIGRDTVEVVLAADGVEAVSRLAEESFSILLTDMNMPRMDGLALLRHARQHHPDILTIIITGYGSMEAAIDAIRDGAYDYIQKPFKIDEIKVPVRNAIEKIILLRERAWLLEELEALYRKVHTLEPSPRPSEKDGDTESLVPTNAAGSTYFLFPRHSIPFSLFDAPKSDPDHILVFLERLKELRRSRVIDEEEFNRLKRMYFSKAESNAI